MLSIPPNIWEKYAQNGPRYTSYPTAEQFKEKIDEIYYQQTLIDCKELSLYCHIPFCNTLCYYCACNKLHTKNETRISNYLSRLYKEITLQGAVASKNPLVTQLHWGGGTPNILSDAQIQTLMEHLSTHFNLSKENHRDFSIELDPRTISSDTLELLRHLGFNRVSFGVQDFDPAVQKAVNRVQSETATADIVKKARQLQFNSINIDLMYGLPLQTTQSFTRTLEKIIHIRPDRIAMYHYAHMPHYFAPQRRIHAKELPNTVEKLELLLLAICQLTSAGYEYIGFDHFALPTDILSVAKHEGTLQRNFQGYTTHAKSNLIGLGVSAIGHVYHKLYVQNYKTITEYYAAIDQDTLPFARGLTLSFDDVIRNNIIQSLMCYQQVHFPVIEHKYHIVFKTYFAKELTALLSLEQDKFVEKTEKYIRVTPIGQLFLRNICRKFDAYL